MSGKGRSSSLQPNGTTPGIATGLAEQIGEPGAGEFIGPPSEVPGGFRETRIGWLVLAAVWAASVAYLGWQLRDSWVPHDAGALAQMAERVLRGQVPQRDFFDIYTGGLTYLNALALRLFGTNFFSLRIPLFLLFLGWVPSVYFVARRFARPLAAGAVTLLAVAWSVPNYPEAMPSWYNLFFATWGILALFRYTETERKRWLWIAGLCGGLSFLVKLSGLYFVAAGLMFLVYREVSTPAVASTRARRALLYRLFVAAGLLLYLGALVDVVSARPTASEFIHFVLPSACVVLFLLWEGQRRSFATSAARLRRLFSMGVPFVGGVLIPVAAFLLWYARQGAVGAWWAGTFVRPVVRTHWVGWDAFSPIAEFVGLLPALLILAAAYAWRAVPRRLVQIAAPLALLGLLLAAWKSVAAYIFVGYAAPVVVPLLALAAPFCLRRSANIGERMREQTFLAIATAVGCSLIQFPTSGAIYFSYVAPLVILGALALLSSRPPRGRFLLGSLLAFYLVFGFWLRTPGYFNVMPFRPDHPVALQRLSLTRGGGLLVTSTQAQEYEKLIPLVRAHARGSYIYAGPDTPEVYFLAGLRNPTPALFGFLDPDFSDVPSRNERILSTIDNHGITVVVINTSKAQSGPLSPGLKAAFDAEFPQAERVDGFEVRWK